MYDSSPAGEAGLISDYDFVIHSISFEYNNLDVFCDAVDNHCQNDRVRVNSIKLVVYNIRDDEIRVVCINPSRDWHNEGGWIGCGFGDGLFDSLRGIQDSLVSKEVSQLEPTERLVSPSKRTSSTRSIGSKSKGNGRKPLSPDIAILTKNPNLYHNVEVEPALPQISLTSDKSEEILISGHLLTEQGFFFTQKSNGLKYRISAADLILLDTNFSLSTSSPMSN